MTTRTRLTAALCSVLVLAACSDEDPPATNNPGPSMTPPTTSASSESPDPATAKAPRVDKPLDATSFVADPCKSLTEAQRADFALEKGKPLVSEETNVPGEGCIFNNHDAQLSVAVTYTPDLKSGLSHFYAQNEAGWFEYWEPTELNGYPAVIAGTARPGTDCTIYVGITDSLSFYVSVIAQTGDGRTAAENVATAVLETIKAGGA